MKTYIRKNIKGYYINFPEEIDSLYWAGKIGSTYLDFLDGKWVLLSDELVAFRTEHPHALVSLVFSMTVPDMNSNERTIEDAKYEKLMAIDNYDNSDNVNSFDVLSNGEIISSAWFTPEQRANYRSSIDAAELVGVDNLSFYIGDIPITLPTQTAKLMLALIQLYADQCFIVTKQHKTSVESLQTILEVDAYDETSGYPTKLQFNI